MTKLNSAALFLIGSISVVSLTGCEQMEQAANDAMEKAKQSAAQVLDEAKQSGSIVDQAKQTANDALIEAKQTAADLLGQTNQYLSEDQQRQDINRTTEENSPSAL